MQTQETLLLQTKMETSHLSSSETEKSRIDSITIKIVNLALEKLSVNIVEANELIPEDIERIETDVYTVTYSMDNDLYSHIEYANDTLKDLLKFIDSCDYLDDVCNNTVDLINKTIKEINSILVQRETMLNG